MSEAIAERFRAQVGERFRFLEDRGFRRSPEDEEASPVGVSVAYAGRHVGFLVSYDVRDQAVDVRVTRARAGRLAMTGEGGYSRNLLSHLVEYAGYRGGFGRRHAGAPPPPGAGWEVTLADWTDLLEREGGMLLADDAGSLPVQ